VIPFHVPPLRERREDLPVLAKAFVEEFCTASGAKRKQIAPRAMSRLQAYAWPGNVRELRNLMERLVLMTPGPKIRAEDLPQDLGDREQREDVEGITLGEARKDFEREFLIARLRENDWNISRTAEGIGIARESLSRKVRSLEIKVPRE
jgi:two-component system nitrogen regulation response regulator NtrX